MNFVQAETFSSAVLYAFCGGMCCGVLPMNYIIFIDPGFNFVTRVIHIGRVLDPILCIDLSRSISGKSRYTIEWSFVIMSYPAVALITTIKGHAANHSFVP